VYVLRLESKVSQSDEGLLMEPGRRQAIPMMAMGSAGSLCDEIESISENVLFVCISQRPKLVGYCSTVMPVI